MEKKIKTVLETAAEGNLRNKLQYLPPVMEFTSFALEKGFATSQVEYDTDTETLDYYNEWDTQAGNGEGFF